MSHAKTGDTVKVHYTGRLKDGTVIDTSLSRDPLEFTLGAGQVIRGFEQAVIGMAPGERSTTNIAAEDAYGAHRQEMVIVLERNRLPEDLEPEVGQQLRVTHPDGEHFHVMITHVSETGITLDANHPLAGQELTFEIQLMEIA
jgi:peptidylprolyl isomerase